MTPSGDEQDPKDHVDPFAAFIEGQTALETLEKFLAEQGGAR